MTRGAGTAIEESAERQLIGDALGSAELISRAGPRPNVSGCSWTHEARRQLNAIRSLPPGWDSHGGPAPNHKIIEAAEGLLAALCTAGDFPKPHINPTPSGGVQFHWESGSRYFEIDVVGEKAAAYLFDDPSTGVEQEGQIFMDETVDHLLTYIHRVYGDE